mmetsp:Transcript_19081/g.27479  ORF Transcript_19081/g.27479 Transcript_19081/m.27479 type:complete len:641 (+) Transcript_19081:87-2009(+)
MNFNLHEIQRRPTAEEALGENFRLIPQSRDTQIHKILTTITLIGASSVESKRESLFVHASPGMGKTFLLTHLYSRNVSNIHFFVADFGRCSCDVAAPHSDVFLSDPGLFILLRLYYVEFVDQSRHPWEECINKVLDRLSTVDKKESFKEGIRRKLRDRVAESGCSLSVILVDEIQKTQAMGEGSDGIQFSNRCRSYLCGMADLYQDICNVVVFSSLDVSFMINETTTSGRPMNSVCTLPLLSYEQTLNILRTEVQCSFVNEEDIDVDRDQNLKQLADVCGGHPRSIEYVVSVCNSVMGEVNRKDLSYVISSAARRLIGAYRQVDHLDVLLKAIILGKEVCSSDLVGDETYESLVNRGVLLNSLDGEGPHKFVPMCPELFLHAWAQSKHVNRDLGRLLRQILDLRGKFTRKRFKNLHCSWEQLIRLARPDKDYEQIPLRDVYCVAQRDYNNMERASESAVSCPVDASAELTLQQYHKGGMVNAQPNFILSPTDDYNTGWDQLIFYDAFPSGKPKRRKFILPVFIQNKFSAEGASAKLTIDTVNTSVQHCKNFVQHQCTFTGCNPVLKKTAWYRSGRTSYEFVLIFVVKQRAHQNTTSEAPPNVIFCFEEDLKILYGKTLSGFVKYLVPDSTIYATTEFDGN